MAESVTDSNVTMESPPQPTSDDEFINSLHEFGLGRGINVTDTHMWKNKTSFTVRKCKRDDIIETNECGLYVKYEKEVLTVSQEQQKIRLMLGDPSIQIKIGIDAQQTQSVSSSMKITGTKVKTRTISFRTSFKDLPPYIQSNSRKPCYKPNEDEESFEHRFCMWILKRIEDRLSAGNSKYDQSKGESITEALEIIFNYFLGDSKSNTEIIMQNRREIAADCEVFVRDLGITHYVSSIELGAMSYNTSTVKSKQKKLSGGVEVQADSYADGKLSGFTQKLSFLSQKEERLIGKITEKKVAEDDEAVIGFQIQPIYSLAPVPLLQPALSKAVKEYIQKKADPTEGPYLISCTMTQESSSNGTTSKGKKETDIYWCVSKEDNCVYGTTKISKASKFHTVPTGDPKHPNEFYIVHWRGGRKRLTNVKDPIVQSRADKCHLPLYLTTDTNILGESEGPLQLRSTILTNQARFCLHSRVQSSFAFMMCLSQPVSLNDWIEGEQFYINCSRRAFKIDGYIAMASIKEPKDNYKFKTATIPSTSDPSSNTKGMLFRLQPPPKKPKLRIKRSHSVPVDLASYRSRPKSEAKLGSPKPPHTQVTDDPHPGLPVQTTPHSDHPNLVHQETAPPRLSSEEEQHTKTTPFNSITALQILRGTPGGLTGAQILLGAALGAARTPVNNVSTMAGQYNMLYPDSDDEDDGSS